MADRKFEVGDLVRAKGVQSVPMEWGSEYDRGSFQSALGAAPWRVCRVDAHSLHLARAYAKGLDPDLRCCKYPDRDLELVPLARPKAEPPKLPIVLPTESAYPLKRPIRVGLTTSGSYLSIMFSDDHEGHWFTPAEEEALRQILNQRAIAAVEILSEGAT